MKPCIERNRLEKTVCDNPKPPSKEATEAEDHCQDWQKWMACTIRRRVSQSITHPEKRTVTN